MDKLDLELKIIYQAFTDYFKKNEIEYKSIAYKYKIELMTADLDISVSIDSNSFRDYTVIDILNTKTKKKTEYFLTSGEEILRFGENEIMEMINKVGGDI